MDLWVHSPINLNSPLLGQDLILDAERAFQPFLRTWVSDLQVSIFIAITIGEERRGK